MSGLTHLDETGRARMVDVSGKPDTVRIAKATGNLICSAETLSAACSGQAPKGGVIATAELAGVMGAKRTANLIPMCHPLLLTKIRVTVEPVEELPGFRIQAEAHTVGPTGVEMEALTAVSVAGLTLYDMLKALDRGMRLTDVRLISKSGGQSGDWSGK